MEPRDRRHAIGAKASSSSAKTLLGDHDRRAKQSPRSMPPLNATMTNPAEVSGHLASNATQVERLAIIGADVCLRTGTDASISLFEKSQGRVYPVVVEALQDKTDKARKRYPGIAVVWVIHFPPTSLIALYQCLLDYHLVEQASKMSDVDVGRPSVP